MQRGTTAQRVLPNGATSPFLSCGRLLDESQICHLIYAYTYSYTDAVRGRFMTLSFGDPMPVC